MKRAHHRSEPCGLADRCSHGVRNVVQLQIQKDRPTPPPHHLYRPRALSREELEAHLEERHCWVQLLNQRGGCSQVSHIQGYNQFWWFVHALASLSLISTSGPRLHGVTIP